MSREERALSLTTANAGDKSNCGEVSRHQMSLRPKPFEAIASGVKRYELRLHDEKRREIRIGDEITFTCTADERQVLTKVIGLHPYSDFNALYASLPLEECGYTKENVHRADPRDMEAYYPPEKQALYGVLAIELERVRCPIHLLAGEFKVCELNGEDIPEMLRLAQGNPMYYEHMRVSPDASAMADALKALPSRRTKADKHFFGWFDGDRLVAMMDLILRHPKPETAFIGWFMVDAAYQGQGLGRKLAGDVLGLLSKMMGVAEVRLGRISGNPQSERFWKACGFRDTELGYDTDAYHVIVMKKEIE